MAPVCIHQINWYDTFLCATAAYKCMQKYKYLWKEVQTVLWKTIFSHPLLIINKTVILRAMFITVTEIKVFSYTFIVSQQRSFEQFTFFTLFFTVAGYFPLGIRPEIQTPGIIGRKRVSKHM